MIFKMEEAEIFLSAQYAYIRGRQLEGTFPGDRWTGIWGVTVMRIGHGWGAVPEQHWPYDTSVWPPIEPEGLDSIARNYRRDTYYRRVRSVEECKAVMGQMEMPVCVALKISDDWYGALGGKIPWPQSNNSTPVGSHSVLLVGYNDEKGEFTFQNSWGIEWGDRGFGYLPYQAFSETLIEGWAQLFLGKKDWQQPASGKVAHRSWGIIETTDSVVHGHEIVGPRGDRIGWAYAVERGGVLEVEELFVMPKFRRLGYGRTLADSMNAQASQKALPLRFWISHPDGGSENLAAIRRLLHPFRLQCRPSPEQWASHVFDQMQ